MTLVGERGVHVDPAFLDPAACARIRAAMDRGASEPADILDAAITLDRLVAGDLQVSGLFGFNDRGRKKQELQEVVHKPTV